MDRDAGGDEPPPAPGPLADPDRLRTDFPADLPPPFAVLAREEPDHTAEGTLAQLNWALGFALAVFGVIVLALFTALFEFALHDTVLRWPATAVLVFTGAGLAKAHIADQRPIRRFRRQLNFGPVARGRRLPVEIVESADGCQRLAVDITALPALETPAAGPLDDPTDDGWFEIHARLADHRWLSDLSFDGRELGMAYSALPSTRRDLEPLVDALVDIGRWLASMPDPKSAWLTALILPGAGGGDGRALHLETLRRYTEAENQPVLWRAVGERLRFWCPQGDPIELAVLTGDGDALARLDRPRPRLVRLHRHGRLDGLGPPGHPDRHQSGRAGSGR